MSSSRKKTFWISGVVISCVFLVLLSIRAGLFRPGSGSEDSPDFSSADFPERRENWMEISQNDGKIGFSHSVFSRTESGFHMEETVFVRINTLGMVQDIHLENRSRLHPDFTLESFDATIRSGRFDFNARGRMKNGSLIVKTGGSGAEKETSIQVGKKLHLFSGVLRALSGAELKEGDRMTFDVFDPAVMGHAPVTVEVLGGEIIDVMGEQRASTKVSLDFKGAAQTAWLGENGDILREEGLLGIRLEKTTREAALSDAPRGAPRDLTLLASVESNATFDDPWRLTRLKIRVEGVDLGGLRLHGGRQNLENDLLTIRKESPGDGPRADDATRRSPEIETWLGATAFIQSDHPDIRKLAGRIVARDDAPALKARKLIDWVHENIEKKPALSVPDALSTLKNRVGDCNEHAVLLAALARAAGVPAKIEAGLAYLKGRFYYHAWNSLYTGAWITADSVFGQFPADVTHIRFSGGAAAQQLDLVGLIGKVRITVLEYD